MSARAGGREKGACYMPAAVVSDFKHLARTRSLTINRAVRPWCR